MPENVKCPECGGRMVSRLNQKQQRRFWGCADYPTCRGTRDTDGLSKADRAREADDPWKSDAHDGDK